MKKVSPIVSKIVIFFIVFNVLFFGVRVITFTHALFLNEEDATLPTLFSAILLIFSIISGFIIQSKWNTWNSLIDATHEELSSLRELYMLSHHFPKKIHENVRVRIENYLKTLIDESNTASFVEERSELLDREIYLLEETIFAIDYTEHPNIGTLSFDLVRKCRENREKRLQNVLHKLPMGVKIFIFFATFATIFTSLFITVTSTAYDYLFTSVIALLVYGIYLLIDDLDNPYRPGQWHLSMKEYIQVLGEIKEDTL
jgi:hypothetical protein